MASSPSPPSSSSKSKHKPTSKNVDESRLGEDDHKDHTSQDADSVAISAPAVVEWTSDDDTTLCLSQQDGSSQVTCRLDWDVPSHAAMFKLVINVALKGQKKQTPIYTFIYPEHIISLTHDEDAESELASRVLRSQTTCLHFGLDKPVMIVGPQGVSLVARKKTSNDVLDALRSLSRGTSFAVYLPSTCLPKTQARRLCAAASNKALKSLGNHAVLASLYSGQGGQAMFPETTPSDPAPNLVNDASLPAYDELGPGPPPPPLSCAANETTDMNSKKRRRTSSSSDEPGSIPTKPAQTSGASTINIERRLLSNLREEIHGLFAQIGHRLSHIQSEQVSFSRRLERLENEHGHDHDRLGQLTSEQLQTQNNVDDLFTKVQELEDEIPEWITSEVDSAKDDLRLDLKDHVAEALEDVEDTIIDSIESANVSLQFHR